VDEVDRVKNRTKSKVRAKVEHPIGIIKRIFGFAKVRYRGLTKKRSSPGRDLCALYLSRAGIYCTATWRNLSGVATSGCGRRRCYTNNGTANSTLSLAAAISMVVVYSPLLVQSFLKYD